MISMSDVHSIRQLRRSGESVAAIAREVGVSRETVYKYLRMEDLSPKMPAAADARPSKLDPYKQLIEQWLDDDELEWRSSAIPQGTYLGEVSMPGFMLSLRLESIQGLPPDTSVGGCGASWLAARSDG